MESAEPYKEFIREMTTRIERVFANYARQAREDRLEIAKRFDALQARGQANTDTILAEIRDLREESRAQTQALLRVIDRLDNGGAATA